MKELKKEHVINLTSKEARSVLKKFIEKEREGGNATNIDKGTLLECAKWCKEMGNRAMKGTDLFRAWKISQAYFAMAEKLEIATIKN